MERLSYKLAGKEHTPGKVRVLQFGEGNFLRAFVDEMIDQDRQDEVFDYFRSAEEDSIKTALNELGEEDYSYEDIQLMRIKFISELGN